MNHFVRLIKCESKLIPNYCRLKLPGCISSSLKNSRETTIIHSKFYYTNANRVKRDDPYATLGLDWSASVTEVKEKFRHLAREYHPDAVMQITSDEKEIKEAMAKFQAIRKAFDIIMDKKGARDEADEEWTFTAWRTGDMIAQSRSDVAGEKRKRPAKPAGLGEQFGGALGHPSGGGNTYRRAEYLEGGNVQGKKSGTVGTGRNKWVKPKEYKSWNPSET